MGKGKKNWKTRLTGQIFYGMIPHGFKVDFHSPENGPQEVFDAPGRKTEYVAVAAQPAEQQMRKQQAVVFTL